MSVFRGADRRGMWRIGRRCTVINWMGGTELDLSEVELEREQTQLNMYSWMGGGQIKVPDGVEVQVSKFAVMGGNEVRLGDDVPPDGAPLLRIRLVSIFGGCSVRRVRRTSDPEARPPRAR